MCTRGGQKFEKTGDGVLLQVSPRLRTPQHLRKPGKREGNKLTGPRKKKGSCVSTLGGRRVKGSHRRQEANWSPGAPLCLIGWNTQTINRRKTVIFSHAPDRPQTATGLTSSEEKEPPRRPPALKKYSFLTGKGTRLTDVIGEGLPPAMRSHKGENGGGKNHRQ